MWAWYKSSAGVTGTTSVSNWADQSGNGNDLIQATTNRQPRVIDNIINGSSVIALKSGGGTQARMVTADPFPIVDGATIFIVACQSLIEQGDTQGVFLEYAQDCEIKRNGSSVEGSLNADTIDTASVTDDVFYTIAVKTNGTDLSLYLNGALHGSGSSFFGPAVQQEFYIFQKHGNANTGNKQIAEIIAYTRELDTDEIASAHSYLRTEYNHY